MLLGELLSNAQPQMHMLPGSPPFISYPEHRAIGEEDVLKTGSTWVRILDLQYIIMMLPVQPIQAA